MSDPPDRRYAEQDQQQRSGGADFGVHSRLMSFDFDVFLSHNSRDKRAVRQLGEALRRCDLRVWFDEWELVPGRPWQEALEEIIETTRAAAVLVGKDGLGPWQESEMRGCISEFVARKLPVIPVLLPGAPERPELPPFLKQFTWVDLRKGITEEGLDRLVWGITGQKPAAGSLGERAGVAADKPTVGIDDGSIARGRFYGLPPATDAVFLGRDEDLERVHETLQPNRAVALTACVSAHGGGGVGKTRLAFEYAWRYAEHYPGGVFWAVVGDREPRAVWSELGRRLFVKDFADDTEATLAFFKALDQCTEPLLVVLDDLAGDRQRFAQRLEIGGGWYPAIPTSVWVRVLITTRFSDVGIAAQPLLISCLATTAAVELLLKRARRTAAEMDVAEALAAGDLDGHPLAVTLAGAYLRKVQGLSIATYRRRLLDKGLTEELEIAAKHAGCVITDHERSIAATFRLSHRLLDTGEPIDAIAEELLNLAAFLAPGVELDQGLLYRMVRAGDHPVESDEAELAAARLEEISLLEPGRKIHAMVAGYVRWSQDSETRRGCCGTLLELTNSLFPEDLKEDAWKILMRGGRDGWEELTVARRQHIVTLNQLADRIAEQHPMIAGRWLHKLAVSHIKIGEVLLRHGDHSGAGAEFRISHDYFKRLVRRYPKKTEFFAGLGRSNSNLADVLQAQGNHNGAQERMKAFSEILPKLFSSKKRQSRKRPGRGPSRRSSREYSKVAGSGYEIAQRNLARGLARVYVENPELKKQPKAENATFFRRVARSHIQLGGVRNLEAARNIFRNLVALDPKNAGWLHDLADSHRGLGFTLQRQGARSKALKEYDSAREILQQLTADDPDYVQWQLELAVLFGDLSSLTMAETSSRGDAIEFLEKGFQILQELYEKDRLPSAQQGLLQSFEMRLQKLRKPRDEQKGLADILKELRRRHVT